MPIEIRELVIRTTVTGGGENTDTPSHTRPSAGGSGKIDLERIVAECVEQVMEILREERER